MKKNVVLILAGVGDFFFGSSSNKTIDKKEKLLNNIKDIVSQKNFKAIVDLTTPHETFKEVNVLNDVRPQSVVGFTLHSEEFLHKNNEMTLLSLDNEDLLRNGDDFDFIFPSTDYDVHICGVDINGAFRNTIESLLDRNYQVTVYSDAIRPFKHTHKYISSLQGTPAFRYCSFKSV